VSAEFVSAESRDRLTVGNADGRLLDDDEDQGIGHDRHG
jgi:hypothetical protein